MPPPPCLLIDTMSLSSASGLASPAGSSLLQGAGVVAGLAMLEAALSADNAVALAGLVQAVQPASRRARILNQGLLCAFLLRGLMILAASWVIRYEAIRVLGGLYLVWLALRHFREQFQEAEPDEKRNGPTAPSDLALLGVIACTDLAFSIDSVSAAVALSDNLVLVLLGGALGVGMLRFLTGWVIQWMERYIHLANAAYLTVLVVGLRMLARALAPALDPPEGMVLVVMLTLFVWGFSRRDDSGTDPSQGVEMTAEAPSRSGSRVCSTPILTRANTARV